MSQNYPDLPKSPISSASNPDASLQKKSPRPSVLPTSPAPVSIRKSPPSPLSKTSELKSEDKDKEEKVEDFDKYEVRRAAIGTGIFSSMLTLSSVSNLLFILFFY